MDSMVKILHWYVRHTPLLLFLSRHKKENPAEKTFLSLQDPLLSFQHKQHRDGGILPQSYWAYKWPSSSDTLPLSAHYCHWHYFSRLHYLLDIRDPFLLPTVRDSVFDI